MQVSPYKAEVIHTGAVFLSSRPCAATDDISPGPRAQLAISIKAKKKHENYDASSMVTANAHGRLISG